VFDSLAQRVGLDASRLREMILRVLGSPVNVTAAYTIQPRDHHVRANATGGAFSVTLPDSKEVIGRTFHVKRLNAGANNVTIAAAGTDTIDGAATLVLAAQYASAQLYAAGAGLWDIQ
jgi:hypothetical protein